MCSTFVCLLKVRYSDMDFAYIAGFETLQRLRASLLFHEESRFQIPHRRSLHCLTLSTTAKKHILQISSIGTTRVLVGDSCDGRDESSNAILSAACPPETLSRRQDNTGATGCGGGPCSYDAQRLDSLDQSEYSLDLLT